MRKKDSLSTSFKAQIYLINTRWFLDGLVETDFQKELQSNKQLGEADSNAKQRFREELISCTQRRATLLRRKLLLSLGWILIGIIGSLLLIFLFKRESIQKITVPSILGILSILSFSVATLGRLGWEGQSWKGDTVFEQLDNRLFWFLYLVGTGLGVAAFLI